jgi:hypothetical protein
VQLDQDALSATTKGPIANTGNVRGTFVMIPDAERADTITLRYVPDLGAISEPPQTGDIALRARQTTYSEGTSVEFFQTVYACRMCQKWTSIRHCSDPSRPGTCQNLWVPDGPPESQCGTAPSWMVNK